MRYATVTSLLRSILNVCSGNSTLVDAIREYDEDVITRGRKEVEVSRIQTESFHDFDNFSSSPLMRHGIQPNIDVDRKGE